MDILIDIETLPIDARTGMSLDCAPGWVPPPTKVERKTPPSNWKDPEKIARWEADEDARFANAIAEELDANRGAALEEWRRSVFRFDGVRIATIGVSGASYAWVFEAESEKDEQSMLKNFVYSIPDRGRIITFGDYDARVIRARLLAHGLPLGPFSPWRGGQEVKPWDRRVVDLQRLTADVLNGAPNKITGISVDALCEFLGIERFDNPIDGSRVLDAYVDGRWDDIVAHCLADVRDEWAIWTRLMEVM